jgi:hypothetical protein
MHITFEVGPPFIMTGIDCMSTIYRKVNIWVHSYARLPMICIPAYLRNALANPVPAVERLAMPSSMSSLYLPGQMCHNDVIYTRGTHQKQSWQDIGHT